MSCTSPVSCFRDPTVGPRQLVGSGVDLDTGEVSFSRPPGISFTYRSGWERINIQCGKCDGCRADRAREWSIRAYHESTLHERNCFLTLTYADAPPALVKADLQNFFKRARHKWRFRYLACGEYGDRTRRPHYHALIFGEDWLGGAEFLSQDLYTQKDLADCWSHGLVSAGSLTMASCCYVAGYVFKKIGDKETFSLQSRRPPIGHGWYARYKDDLVRTGSVVIEGREYPVPRRYMTWDDLSMHDLKMSRAELMKSRAPKSLSDEVVYSRRLASKALNQRSKLKLKEKRL